MRVRSNLRSLLVPALVILIVFLCLASLLRVTDYPRMQAKGARLIEALADRRPPDVSSRVWADATGWAITAYHNVCFSAEHVSRRELQAFVDDVESKLDGAVDLETIDWIWRRLAKTGPHGRQYVDKFEPEYRMHVYDSNSLSWRGSRRFSI